MIKNSNLEFISGIISLINSKFDKFEFNNHKSYIIM
jgi:hypothetical protein